MERNRKNASLITQSVLIISIQNSFVFALIGSLEKVQKKTARHVKEGWFLYSYVSKSEFVFLF